MAKLVLKPKIEPLVILTRPLAEIGSLAADNGRKSSVGTTYGLVDAMVSFDHNDKLWQRVPGKPAWVFKGTETFVKLVTTMYLPLEHASNLQVMSIVKRHEMRHVQDASDIVTGDLLKTVGIVWKYQTLFQEDEVSELTYQTYIKFTQFDEMIKQAFAPRWEKKINALDTQTTYTRLTWEVNAATRK